MTCSGSPQQMTNPENIRHRIQNTRKYNLLKLNIMETPYEEISQSEEYIEEEDYYSYDPEIESLMDLNNFTEKEKEVIR